jgi:L-2,4-diaminobutyrate decarboxylase
MTDLLKKAYSSITFGRIIGDISQIIQNKLETAIKGERNVINYVSPDDLYNQWVKKDYTSLHSLTEDIIQQSVLIHHPKYVGHQVCMPLPIGTVTSMLGSHLNNGMAVYEMGMAASVIDRLMVEELNPYFGYGPESAGIFTSGGTIANITALLCARAHHNPLSWKYGTNEKLGFMVSDQAHYCIDRAVKIMGLGDDGMVIIPSDQNYVADVSLLEEVFQNAKDKGITVIGIVGSAPSTATGKYDDLEIMGKFALKHKLWFHIDAAHGGPAVLSNKYKHLMHGCGLADSITVDAHKMMMMPALTTMLLFKNHEDSYKTFAQEASYLFGHEELDWSNYGKRTMECTKIMLGMRLYAAWKEYGPQIFIDNLERCYDLAKEFESLLLEHGQFELPVSPHSNIVCFRISEASNNEIETIREKMLKEGKFYLLKTKLRDKVYFRCSLMNPFTTKEDLKIMITDITNKYKKLLHEE